MVTSSIPPIFIDVNKLALSLGYFYRPPLEETVYRGAIDSEDIRNPKENHSLVLRFDGRTAEGAFTIIASEYTPERLALELVRAPSELANPIIQALKGTKLDLSLVTAEETSREMTKIQEAEANIKRIGELNAIGLPSPNAANFKAENTVYVSQHEIGYTNGNNSRYILGTSGIGGCITVALYNPYLNCTALTHLDEWSDIPTTLNTAFCKLKDKNKRYNNLEVHLYGGDSTSYEILSMVLDCLSRQQNISIRSCSVARDEEASYMAWRFAINARTGDIYTQLSLKQLDIPTDIKNRLEQVDLQQQLSPATVIYDGIPSSKER